MFLPKRDRSYIFCFKLNRQAKLFSTLMILACIAIPTSVFLFVSNSYICWWTLLMTISVFSLISMRRPIALYFNDEELEIHGVLEEKRIDYSNITGVYAINYTYINYLATPIFASSGVMGFLGVYYSRDRDKIIRCRCTQRDNMILLECKDGRDYIISATERDKMIRLIKGKMI